MITRSPLRISLAGTRGIPARYGGFETFAEELSKRLVHRGHSVTVYGRRGFGEKVPEVSYQGVNVRYCPTVKQKFLETPLHALSTMLDVLRHPCDVLLLCNAANSPFAFLPRIRGVPIAINVDGIERLRSKWNRLGKAWYRLGERCSVLFADEVVSDAHVIARYYQETYEVRSAVISYGATVNKRSPGKVLEKYGLTPRGYFLYVSRFEPENNPLGVVQAYSRMESTRKMPLVMVGDAPYAKDYIQRVKEAAGPGVIFTGFQFEEPYYELRSNCFAYIQATEVGGTHPALVEAMAYGNCVIANGTPEHAEVLGEAGMYYPKNDFVSLTKIMEKLTREPELVSLYGGLASKRADEKYQWDLVTDQYETLFYDLVARKRNK